MQVSSDMEIEIFYAEKTMTVNSIVPVHRNKCRNGISYDSKSLIRVWEEWYSIRDHQDMF